MDRREAVLGPPALGAAPLATEAQQPAGAPRIGFLTASGLSSISARTRAFRDGLRDLGYVEGQNIVIEWRSADEAWARLPTLPAGLVNLKPAVAVAGESASALALKQVAKTLPIVVATSGDPVGLGLAASLARPGGNVTGLTGVSTELWGKRAELLKELVASISRVAVLFSPGSPASTRAVREAETAARRVGLRVETAEVRDTKDVDNAFSATIRERADALLVLNDAVLLTERTQIADLAARNHLPAMYGAAEYVEAGGLMAYAANRVELFRRAATFVDKILKGAKPADLTIEQATKFDLIINLKTPRALSLKIPQALLLRADEVIQ